MAAMPLTGRAQARPLGRPHGRPPSLARPPATSSLLLVAILLAACVGELAAESTLSTCGPGLVTPGVTVPQGDIILEEGQLLELYCVLNLTHPATRGRNASNLAFYRTNRTIGPEHLQVLNETTLRLRMRPDVSSSMYYCKLNAFEDAPEEVVCLNSVAVGYQPQNVSEFSCVSQNWQSLTCSWKKKFNPVKTRYTIWYRLPGRAGGRIKYACPTDSDLQNDKCMWNESTEPPYRLPHETYFFILEGSNHFNTTTYHFKLNHYAYVIPAKVKELKVKEKTSYSAFLEWHVPYPLQNFPPGLVHRVEYLPQWESRETWQRIDTSQLNVKQIRQELNITSLKYANTLYDIRVYLKSAKANVKDDNLWSAPAAVTVRTKPDLPGAPPRTDIGSFELYDHVDNRDIYIYWQTIPDYLQNADNFSYKITSVQENGVTSPLEPSQITKKYAKFSKISHHKSLRLEIASSNAEGLSVNRSEIIIPPRDEVPPGPVSVTKVFYENGLYELSWKPPTALEARVTSYTIFWCDSINDHMCSGYLNWTHVPKNTTMRNMTVEGDNKSYQFAVSANTEVASSGMVWASCTILYNKPIQRMKNVWVKKVGSTFMELGWNLDCLDRNGLVIGFRIYYCPVLAPLAKGSDCKSARQNITINNPQQSSANLTGLRPYATYSVTITVLSSGGESSQSEPLLNVTSEAAPSPPQNVSIVSITNTSISISWYPPEEKNGVIYRYEVYYDGKVQTKKTENKTDEIVELVLSNLTSYYNYSISVAACTNVACSDRSPPLTAETKVGEPGLVNAPHVYTLNQSLLSVKWDAPARQSGLLDYYEVNLTYPVSDNVTDKIYETTNTSLIVRIEGCSEAHHPYQFSVRAVNVDPNTGTEFKGKWSQAGEGNCYTKDLPEYLKVIIYLLMIFFTVFVSCLLVCIGKRIWYKCKDMRDVEVKLPPGIVRPREPDRDQDFKMHQWVNLNHDSKPPHGLCPAADEERLLQQKNEHHHDRNLSGDSSGCSSGHESVSSSATEGTHISSDSGTEVDRNEQGSWEAGSDSGSDGQRQTTKSPNVAWDEAYAYVGSDSDAKGLTPTANAGAKGAPTGGEVRSTPNLANLELEPGYTVLSLASWASSGTIPDKAAVAAPAITTTAQGYVPLDAAMPLPPPASKQGSVARGAHPSLLWDRPDGPEAPDGVPKVPKGYVQTGGGKESFTPESEGSWEEPLRLQQMQMPMQMQAQCNNSYVKAGERVGVVVRPSRTEPSLGAIVGGGCAGYVMTGDNGLPLTGLASLARHKPETAPSATPVPASKQAHEYVLTGEREAPRPLVEIDPAPLPPKAYCRVSERERDSLVRPSSSGYVPHRQLEASPRTPGPLGPPAPLRSADQSTKVV